MASLIGPNFSEIDSTKFPMDQSSIVKRCHFVAGLQRISGFAACHKVTKTNDWQQLNGRNEFRTHNRDLQHAIIATWFKRRDLRAEKGDKWHKSRLLGVPLLSTNKAEGVHPEFDNQASTVVSTKTHLFQVDTARVQSWTERQRLSPCQKRGIKRCEAVNLFAICWWQSWEKRCHYFASLVGFTASCTSEGDFTASCTSESDFTASSTRESDFTASSTSESDFTASSTSESDFTASSASESDFTASSTRDRAPLMGLSAGHRPQGTA